MTIDLKRFELYKNPRKSGDAYFSSTSSRSPVLYITGSVAVKYGLHHQENVSLFHNPGTGQLALAPSNNPSDEGVVHVSRNKKDPSSHSVRIAAGRFIRQFGIKDADTIVYRASRHQRDGTPVLILTPEPTRE